MTANTNAAIEQAKADEKRGFVFDKNYTVLKKAPESLAGEYEVPGCVTLIANLAFDKCKKLTSVVFPPSVKCIEFEAFASCDALEKVSIKPGLRIIASGAFVYCQALKRIALPETVEILGHAVFDGCENLREAALPENIRKVCADTFESTPVEKSALAGIPADKIIPAMDCWEDQEIMRLDDMDNGNTERGGCDGVMEWLLKYEEDDSLAPYEVFLTPPEREE